ncbi:MULTISPECIES: hypothetical protein [Paraclostridium]|uniref:Uncharacterized protein n=2 Tax=Paraclostridium TaxID=1849822 RepID=A0A0M3DCI1_9FIRM|nr:MULTISPECIES: hypothetical protein [Paraclostridium]EQK42924.1 hypothetical protein C672_1868 [[Clostridium] bifermentans ATCC 638] [Paraclostridium bifermentans ATCC 638 = DSM 14991]KKX99835.1 hypothetical protein VN21_17320 [Paraclostridium benzoelyticum]RIZ58051.1 hypothetical protein CHH45_13465 [Paraclostridium bifermentans]TQO55644.1 hypothetical protein D5S05_17310 [Paraclostridium bifermentans]UAG16807.1 hypothetical protein KXZ80_08380 [Paraclostridium bifermentans]
MNLQKIKESITSFSVQFNGEENRGISYILMLESNEMISNYFNIDKDTDLNNKELLEDLICADVKNNYLKEFVKKNYSTLSVLGFINEDENKIMKELI